MAYWGRIQSLGVFRGVGRFYICNLRSLVWSPHLRVLLIDPPDKFDFLCTITPPPKLPTRVCGTVKILENRPEEQVMRTERPWEG